ncbi:Carbamoyl-phosphate synthase large chain [Dissostichus eleginoides]|uniref:Carbamoyl-phosphate synthase large chain n=1 Tax=Dissostichus eleginoides TaxID=100907 RepID=A0AAD9BDH1_DISEL|nr:Carbamoyl-phosphate synthase large chain [Dissostichus eleginoides]
MIRQLWSYANTPRQHVLITMIAHQPVVKLTGMNGGEAAQQEQQPRRTRSRFSLHPAASSGEASHPARPIYNITFNGKERASIPVPERGLVVPGTGLT